MKKKILKMSNIMLESVFLVIALISLAGFIFALLGKSLANFEYLHLIYMTLGVIFTPIEFLINKTIGYLEDTVFFTLSFALSIMLLVLMIIGIIDKIRASREEEANKKYYNIVSMGLSVLLLIFFSFSLIVLINNYSGISYYLIDIAPMVAKNVGENFIIIEYIVVDSVVIFAVLFNIFANLLARKKNATAVKIYGTTNFYSREYEEPKNETQAKSKNNEDKTESEGIKEQKPQARDLVLKIMKLEELRESGQITNVEYTKLRQKTIKRYKG